MQERESHIMKIFVSLRNM